MLSSMLLGCDARPCTYPDIGCNLGSVAGLAAAHGATAECFETYPLWRVGECSPAARPRSTASTRA
jgi:hypothetical protein